MKSAQFGRFLLQSFLYIYTIISFVVLTAALQPVYAAAGINRTINFQGKVVNKTSGTNITNGNYDFTFKVYDAASSGTLLWTETRTSGNQVTVTDGIFRVSLGSVTPFASSIDFNTDSLYLDVTFNGEAFGSRVQLTAVPYALNAEKVSGLTVTNTSGTLTIPNSKTVSFADSFTTAGAFGLTLTTTGTTNATLPAGTIALLDTASSQTLTNKTIGSTGLTFSGATNDIITGSNEHFSIMPNGTGNVGIATTAPASLFSVGASSQFQVNSSGSIAKLNNVTYTSWPSSNSAGVLSNNGSGALTWNSVGASSITLDSLDFAQFKDSMTLDASTTIDNVGYNFNIIGTGYVGIGTNSPNAPLDVYADNPFGVYSNVDNTSTIGFANSQYAGYFVTGDSNPGTITDDIAVYGLAQNSGALNSIGVYGQSLIGKGVVGVGGDIGGYFQGGGSSSTALYVEQTNPSGRGLSVTGGADNYIESKLGIGVAPSEELDLGAAAANMTFSSSTGPHQIKTAGTSALVLMPGGNVGIGTTAPGFKLEVRGPLLNNNYPYNLATYDNTTAYNVTPGGGIAFGGKYSSGGSTGVFSGIRGIKENATDNNYAGALTFYTVPNAGVSNERMRIDSAGNVGIGTTDTTLAKLYVNGDIKLQTGSKVVLYGTSGSSDNSIFRDTGTGDTVLSSPASLQINTGLTTRLVTVTSGGNVGIGNTNPATGKLQVQSDVNTLARSVFTNINAGSSRRQDIQISTGASSTEAIYFGVNIGASGYASYLDNRSTGNFQFQNSGVASMTITTGGLINIPSLTASSAVYTDGSKNLTTSAPSTGSIGYWTRTGTTLTPTTSGDILSAPGTGSLSEVFGAGASAGGTDGLAIGQLANSGTGIQNIAIGKSATVSGDYSIAIGRSASTSTYDAAVAIGRSAAVTGSNSTAIGYSASAGVSAVAMGYGSTASGQYSTALNYSSTAAGTASIAIGYTATATNAGSMAFGYQAADTAAYQVVFGGSTTYRIQNVVFGTGVTNASAASFPVTIQSSGGSGTDIAGAGLVLAGGKGTGTAAGGSITFSTSDATTTGATLQSLSAKMIIQADGNVGVATTTPDTDLDVEGTTGLTVGRTTPGVDDAGILYLRRRDTSVTAPNNLGRIDFTGDDAQTGNNTVAASIRAVTETDWTTATNYNSKLSFFTSPATSGTLSERLTILSNGNVGIGTTAPNAALDVLSTATNMRLSYSAAVYTAFNTDSSGNLTIDGTGSQTQISDDFVVAAGNISMTNGTSNMIDWNTAGSGAPTFTTRSNGTKLILYPTIGASNVDYAIGIESAAMWSSVTNTAATFKWYGGTTQSMTLTGAGVLDVTGGAQFGSGNVNLVDSTGKIPALTSTYFTSLDANTLTNLNATNLGTGNVPAARMPALTGDVTSTVGTVATTIAADAVALSTDTTGNYVGTITAGTGITTSGAATGEGIAHSLSVNQAFTPTWTGAHIFSNTATFNGAATFNTDMDLVMAGAEDIVISNSTMTNTNGLLDISSSSSTTNAKTVDISSTFTSTGATTSYGLYNTWASSAVVAGASVSQTGYGNYNTAAKTGADSATGTYTLYGTYSAATNTGSTAGSKSTYGGYFTATGDTGGNSSAVGVYGTASGADTNYAGLFEGKVYTTNSFAGNGLDVGMQSVYNNTTSGGTSSSQTYAMSASWINNNVITGAATVLDGTGASFGASKTGVDTTTGAVSVTGLRGTASNTGATGAANRTATAGYFSVTGDTGGISTAYGLYVTGGGSDTNYGLYIDDLTGTSQFGIYQSAATDFNYFAGNVGIGNVAASQKLDVEGLIQTDLGTSQSSIALCHAGSTAGAGTNNDVNIVDCTGTITADYMEMYSVQQGIEMGDIVSPSNEYITTTEGDRVAKLTKTSTAYQASVIGIVSDKSKAGDFNSIGYNIKSEDNPEPIAVNGRVLVKVTSANGTIKAGDRITSSSISGVGMKANEAGFIVGKALEDYDNSDPNVIGKVMVYVNPSWYDPGILVNQMGDVVSTLKTNVEAANTSTGTALNVFGEQITLIQDKVSANEVALGTLHTKVSSQNDRIATLEDKYASLAAQITESSTEPSTEENIDVETINASLSALSGLTRNNSDKILALEEQIHQLTASQGNNNNEAVLGAISNLTSQLGNLKNVVEELERNATQSAQVTQTQNPPANPVIGEDLTLSTLIVSDKINVNNLSVAGTIKQGVLTIEGMETVNGVAGATINTFMGPLRFQTNALSNVEFQDAKIVMEPNGNIKANEIVVKKVKIDTSDEEKTTLGEGTIASGSAEIVIETKSVTDKSKVFVTATSEVETPLVVIEKTEGKSFKVKIKSAPSKNVTFDWWIVN